MLPKSHIEIISGKAKISNLFRKSNVHSFIVNAKTTATILDNTVYFPGWRVEVDGLKVLVQFQDINHRGLITFNVSEGIHKVRVVFGESAIRLFSDIVSIVTLLLIIFLVLFGKRLYNKKIL